MKTERFKSLVNQYKNMIYNQAYYFMGNPDDAADITQEVLIKMWKNLERLTQGSIKSWLLTVTRNQCIDFFRKKKDVVLPEAQNIDTDGDVFLNQTDKQNNPEQELMVLDRKHQLETALQQLSPQTRTIMIMREIQQLSYAEIADAMNSPINTVKVNIHRGRKKLFQILKNSHRKIEK